MINASHQSLYLRNIVPSIDFNDAIAARYESIWMHDVILYNCWRAINENLRKFKFESENQLIAG